LTNNFYRKQSDNLFIADNTDSKGFLKSLKNNCVLSAFDLVLVLGSGAVSRLVLSTLQCEKDLDANIHVLSRNKYPSNGSQGFFFLYEDYIDIAKKNAGASVLLVNCTSVGDYTNPDMSILKEVPPLKVILDSLDIVFFFDVIHTPNQTVLSAYLSHAKCINGKEMNLYQAVLGFSNVYPDYSLSYIEQMMSLVQ